MKKSIKKIVKKIPIDFTKNQKYDSLTVKIMKIVLEEDSTFVDVGCHKGEVLSIALNLAPKGNHFGFEPIPEFANALERNFGKVCQIKNVGLSTERGTSKFNYVKSNPAYSGINKRAYPGEEKIEEIEIEIDTLDNQVYDASRVDLIKIDVEGGELGVLKGAEKTLSKFTPIVIFEFGLGAADYYNVKPEDVWDYFESMKYSIFTLKSFVSRKNSLKEKEFTRLYNSNKEYYFVAKSKV